MKKVLVKNTCFIFLLANLFFGYSCKTDEFKFGELTVKEDWDIEIITPLFIGDSLEFRDFIHDWYKQVPNLPGPKTVLDYTGTFDKIIPTQLIFNPSAVIDSFPFYIQGRYSFTEIALEFKISNGCPLPLYLQLEFFDRVTPGNPGPPVLPGVFNEAAFISGAFQSVSTSNTVKFDSLQVQSFNNSDRVKFTSWFGDNGYTDSHDTLSAHYPVEVLIVLSGKVKAKNEE